MSSSDFDYRRLRGEWWNQLRSRMVMVPDGKGSLTGTYHTKVGGVLKEYPLSGRFDVNASSGVGVTIGWTVTYFVPPNPPGCAINSTATWSGQFFDDPDRKEQRILTHWLLSRSSTKADLWNSTSLGTDSFSRTPPSAQDIERAKASAFASPHVENVVSFSSGGGTGACNSPP